MARMLEKYRNDLLPAWMKERELKSPHAVPKLEKITISLGVGRTPETKKRLESSVKDISRIAGQRPVITRARKSVAGFKVREGDEVGCRVTLRGKKMYEFLDRLISIVIPRIRDFRGLSPRAFDRAGNYSMGLGEQFVFPEIKIDEVEFPQGMNVTLTIRSRGPEESIELLRRFGMPFRKQ